MQKSMDSRLRTVGCFRPGTNISADAIGCVQFGGDNIYSTAHSTRLMQLSMATHHSMSSRCTNKWQTSSGLLCWMFQLAGHMQINAFADLVVLDMLGQPPITVDITEVQLAARSQHSVCFLDNT